MNKTLLIAKREYISIVRKRSFWLATLAFPALILGLSFISGYSSHRAEQKIKEEVQAATRVLILDEAAIINENTYQTQFEKVDDLVGHLLDNIDSRESLIAVTADHSTPVKLKEHSGDPVPLAITGEGVRTDNVSQFSEIDCSHGGLGRIKGIDLIPILVDLMGKSKKYGS